MQNWMPQQSLPLALAFPPGLTFSPGLTFPLALTFMVWPFLWGGVALTSIPILIHLLNRRRFRVVSWAAMDYLLKAMRRNRKRLKFEQWLLLAVRCLVVFLIGFALARPIAGCSGSALASLGGRSGLNVFIIDNSYSAGYESPRVSGAKTHLEQEKIIARKLIDQLNAGGESVAIITAAHPAMKIMARPGYDLIAAKAAIDRIEQSYQSTDLAGALSLAIETAKEEQGVPVKSLNILSDGTRSAWDGPQAEAIRQRGTELPKYFKPVRHYNMTEGRQQWNRAILDVGPTSNLVTTKFATDLSTTARGYGAGPTCRSPGRSTVHRSTSRGRRGSTPAASRSSCRSPSTASKPAAHTSSSRRSATARAAHPAAATRSARTTNDTASSMSSRS